MGPWTNSDMLKCTDSMDFLSLRIWPSLTAASSFWTIYRSFRHVVAELSRSILGSDPEDTTYMLVMRKQQGCSITRFQSQPRVLAYLSDDSSRLSSMLSSKNRLEQPKLCLVLGIFLARCHRLTCANHIRIRHAVTAKANDLYEAPPNPAIASLFLGNQYSFVRQTDHVGLAMWLGRNCSARPLLRNKL
jgi:hypothetical protein